MTNLRWKSLEDLDREAKELVSDALILEPDSPAKNIAQRILDQCEVEFLEALGRMLVARYLKRLVGVARRKIAAAQPKEPLLFPEWNALPERIPISDGVKAPLRNANISQLRAYLRTLELKQAEQTAALRVTREIEQVLALIDLMGRYAARSHGITAGEVAFQESQR